MKYLVFLFLLCAACEESGTAAQRSVKNTCDDFGQLDEPWNVGSQSVTFYNDCSASFSTGCDTVFTYGSFENISEESDRVQGYMPVNIISGHDWAGCPQVGDTECEINLLSFPDGTKSLLLKCDEDVAGISFTNVVPDE